MVITSAGQAVLARGAYRILLIVAALQSYPLSFFAGAEGVCFIFC